MTQNEKLRVARALIGAVVNLVKNLTALPIIVILLTISTVVMFVKDVWKALSGSERWVTFNVKVGRASSDDDDRFNFTAEK